MTVAGPRRALQLALVSAVGRAPAFLIPILIAAAFGAGTETDAYFIAYTAVLFLGGTLAQGVEQAVVPLAVAEIERSPGSARRYLDRAATATTLVAASVWAVGLPLVTLAAPAQVRNQVLRFGLCLTILPLAWCAAAVYAGALVSQWRIGTSTGSMLARGVGALLGLATLPFGGGLWTVGVGLGMGECARLWWLRRQLWVVIGGEGPEHQADLRQFARAAAAQSSASAATSAAPVVERMLALAVGVGAASHLEYAVRLLVLPGVAFEGALAPLLFVKWTHQIAKGSPPTPRDVRRAVLQGVGLASACAVALALLAPFLVDVLLNHGRFTDSDAASVVSLLRLFCLAFVGTMGALLMERLYLASARNRTLAVLSVARVAVRLGVIGVLLPSQGLAAFPLGYAVADWTYLFVLLGAVRHLASSPMPVASRS